MREFANWALHLGTKAAVIGQPALEQAAHALLLHQILCASRRQSGVNGSTQQSVSHFNTRQCTSDCEQGLTGLMRIDVGVTHRQAVEGARVAVSTHKHLRFDHIRCGRQQQHGQESSK